MGLRTFTKFAVMMTVQASLARWGITLILLSPTSNSAVTVNLENIGLLYLSSETMRRGDDNERQAAGNGSFPTPIPTLSVIQIASKHWKFRVGTAFTTYAAPTIASIGLVGNSLSFLVMLQKHNRRISCCVYMAALAVSDNCLLILAGGYHWGVPRFRSYGFSDLECMWFQFFFMTSSFLGVVFIVSMTVDRFLAIRFPLKSPRWCSTKRAKITIVVTTITILIYHIPYILYSKAVKNGKQCAGLAVQNSFTKVYAWISVCCNSIVPFTMLLILNGLIISTIQNRKKFFQSEAVKSNGHGSSNDQSSGTHGQSDEKTRQRQLTFTLLLVSFAVLVLTGPHYTCNLLYTFLDYTKDPDMYADYIIFINFASKVFMTNNAANFFLYCIGGSKFRQDLVTLFSCCQFTRKQNMEKTFLTPATSMASTISHT